MIPPFSFIKSGGPPPFDPATLSPTLWSPAPYSGAPWVDLIAGTAPSVGTAVNGKTPASFVPASQHFLKGPNLEDIFALTAYTVILLAKPTGAAAPAGSVYDNQQLVANGDDFAIFGTAWSTSGVKGWHAETGPTYKETNWAACAADAYSMVAQTFGGGTLGIAVNNGTPETVASAGNLSITGLGNMPLRVARNYGATFTQMDLLEVLVFDRLLNGTEQTNVLSYFKATYPAAGLP